MSGAIEFGIGELPEGLYHIQQEDHATRIIPVKLTVPLPDLLLKVDGKRDEELERRIERAKED